MSELKLRDYQQDAVDMITDLLDFECPTKAYCFVLPTGAGKSVIIGAAINDMLLLVKDIKILVCSWTTKIIAQDKGKLDMFMRGEDYDNVDFLTVQQMNRRPVTDTYDVIIVDECHKMYRGTAGYESITARMHNSNKELRNPKSTTIVIGLTATPYRNKHENVINDKMFVGVGDVVTYGALIRRDYLVPPEYIKSPLFSLDRDKLESSGFDYTAESMDKQCDKAVKAIAEMIVSTHDSGKQGVRHHCTLVFLPSIRIVKDVEKRLSKLGHKCGVITGETDFDDREEVISNMGIILNCATMTTGVDITRITSVVVCRATKSWVLWRQIIGRGLRTNRGKTKCYIIDCGGNVEMFGDDLDAMPSVTDSQVTGLPIMSECPRCNRYTATSIMTCPYCDFVLRTKDDVYALNLYNIYFNGGMRPVDGYELSKVKITGKGFREILTIRMGIGPQFRFVFSDHPFSQSKKEEYLDILKSYKTKSETLFIRVEKIKGFDTIVDAKLVKTKPKF